MSAGAAQLDATLGDYRIDRALTPDKTFLATSPNGRRVVLKMLEDDCLLDTHLHPLIKDRLARVRELAHLGVATLLSVERADGQAFVVWEYVEGMPLAEHLAEHSVVPRSLPLDLISNVEALHALGLIHGSLHGHNVIVTPTGHLRLTHVSPLLYHDPDVDVHGLLPLLGEMGCGKLLDDCDCNTPLHTIATRVVGWTKGHSADAGGRNDASAARRWEAPRRRALIGALAAILTGSAVGYALYRNANETPNTGPSSVNARPTR
jgi:hypothetical protein